MRTYLQAIDRLIFSNRSFIMFENPNDGLFYVQYSGFGRSTILFHSESQCQAEKEYKRLTSLLSSN